MRRFRLTGYYRSSQKLPPLSDTADGVAQLSLPRFSAWYQVWWVSDATQKETLFVGLCYDEAGSGGTDEAFPASPPRVVWTQV